MKANTKKALRLVNRFVVDDAGGALAEYSLILIIGLGVFGALIAFRERIIDAFRQATSNLRW